jgi:hypothetical protein
LGVKCEYTVRDMAGLGLVMTQDVADFYQTPLASGSLLAQAITSGPPPVYSRFDAVAALPTPPSAEQQFASIGLGQHVDAVA